MNDSSLITRIVLWAWVISASILIGGGVFEQVVLTPMWAGSPPESVTAWPHGAVQARFFGIATPAYGLSSLILLIASFQMPRRVRTLALIASASGVVVVIWTFLFFIPILQQTQVTRGAGLSGEEITRLVNQFVSWNYLRYVLLFGGWYAGLRAFRMGPAASSEG